ncbi:MAG: transcription termination/antitermination NusG family protein, partial [Pseudomonadota bacterium]
YCPLISRERRSRSNVRRVVEEPLFPSYVFIHADPETQSIAPVRSTQGVQTFVQFGGDYATVSDEIVDQIRYREKSYRNSGFERAEFREGDQVRVSRFGCEQLEAIFACDCGDSRAIVLLNMLGRETRVTVRKQNLAPLQ